MTTELVLLRRKHALTQTELAELVGVNQTTIGRIERGVDDAVRNVRLDTAFALQVVFGKRPGRLFSRNFGEVENAVMGRAAVLDRRLDGLQDRASEHKRTLLRDMVRRAANNPILP